MYHISILLLHQVNLAALENARQGFLEANIYLQQQGKPTMFKIELVAPQRVITLNNGLYTIQADKLLAEVGQTDLVIIPPIQHGIEDALVKNQAFLPWIIDQYQSGTQIASLCLGAFILGSTGLLNGKTCVTHWKAAQEFNKLFPKVTLHTKKILTDENGICTGGGAFSSANLILYLIEKITSRECAIYCSKVFQIDLGRKSQSPFIIFQGQKKHTDDEIIKAQQYIEENFQQRITIDQLCENLSIGRRTFERRFKKATSFTIIEYIQQVKVEAAKRALERSRKTVNEVMYDVGYSDSKAFREVFKKYSGLSPSDYKEKFMHSMLQIA
ncbi:MAG: GlxA family transcriptional regulator [Cyclobacteriaceae bacterium]